AGAASALGIAEDTVIAFGATIVASGTQASRAGTQLTSAFNKVVQNLDKVSKFMGTDFKQALTVDANGAILSLITKISEIENPVERQQAALELFGNIGAKAIVKITNNMPEMNRLLEASSAQFKNATSLQEEYDIASESTANQIQLMKNQFEALQFEIADELIPIIRDVLLPIFTTVIDVLKSLPGPVKTLLIIFGLVTVAVGILAGAIAILTLVSLPWLLIIGAVIVAITALIAIGTLLWKNWDKLGTKTKILLGILMPWVVLPMLIIKHWEPIKKFFG
ncbi:unnamed protein product, partial [marine sediment metagenome]